MSKTFEAPFVQNIVNGAQKFTSADGTNAKTLVVAGSEGTRVDSLMATSDDSAKNLVIVIYDGTSEYVIGTISLASQQGTDGAAQTKDLFNGLDMPSISTNGCLTLKSGWQLRAKMGSAVSSTKTVTVFAQGGDY